MRKLLFLFVPALFAQTPWDKIVMPSLQEAAAAFRAPAAEYGMLHWWNWRGEVTDASISQDLDDLKSRGITGVLIGAGVGVSPRYLSADWFARVKTAVEHAKRRGMVLWIADEGSYPSGFAGGRFDTDYPELRMQVLVSDGKGGARNEFRTSPTRYVHHPNAAKDTSHSLQDYLDPKATKAFLSMVHEEYKKHIGAEFGKTVQGFFGDEPDYSVGNAIPWTPAIYDEFQKRKGYDVRPHTGSFFVTPLTEDARRAKADYWDVWTDLYRDGFTKPQADWCAQNGLRYVVHLNHEDDMMGLVRSQGDYFKAMRPVQVPAVDAIWRQIWMDRTSDFPKLASSVAHLYGRPRSFTESFAVYGRGLSLEQAKWVIDQQFARGINFLLTSILGGAQPNPQKEHFGELVSYVNRASYLLSVGRPSAQIAVYHPTTSMWLGDRESDKSTLAIAKQLLERQRDFDFIDEQSLSSVTTLENGELTNLSGQVYRAVIVPSATVLSKAALDRLREFQKQEGEVIFIGRLPSILNDKSFLEAAKFPGAYWAMHEPSGDVTPKVLAALPEADVILSRASPNLRYQHRRLRDGDLYFFFNEGTDKVSLETILSGRGRAQQWDPRSGRVQALTSTSGQMGAVRLALSLEASESRFIVLGPLPSGAAPADPPMADETTLVDLADGWTLDIDGKQAPVELKYWAELGHPTFSGAARYRREFTMPAEKLAGRQRMYLDCGEVRYSARVWLNGTDLGVNAWKPFRWEVTRALKPGTNVIEIEVRNTPAAGLAGDEAHVKALRDEATKGGPVALSRFNTSIRFDLEMLPSGLRPPVRIVTNREANPR